MVCCKCNKADGTVNLIEGLDLKICADCHVVGMTTLYDKVAKMAKMANRRDFG